MEERKCFICQNFAEFTSSSQHRDNWCISCRICGRYEISLEAATEIRHVAPDQPYLLSWVTRAASERENPLTLVRSNLKELIDSIALPDSPLAVIDNLILYVSKKSKMADTPIELTVMDYPVAYAKSDREFIFLINKAIELGYLEKAGGYYRLGLEGWRRATELRKTRYDSNHAFVAMWFDKKTEKYREAVKAGISNAGYSPIIADEREFTGNIMDFVLARIRESKFVVADFTVAPEERVKFSGTDEPENAKTKKGTRGGVYYEAGFAKGLGLQVIHTCKKENMSINRLHFDVMQENTIFWTDDEIVQTTVRLDNERLYDSSPRNLSEKIYDRIIMILGRGNLKPLYKSTT